MQHEAHNDWIFENSLQGKFSSGVMEVHLSVMSMNLTPILKTHTSLRFLHK